MVPAATPYAQAAGQIPPKIQAAAEEFESVFLSSMLSHMFAGLDTEGPFGGGQAEETYRGLLIEEYGKAITQSGGIGIADTIARELLSLQEVQE